MHIPNFFCGVLIALIAEVVSAIIWIINRESDHKDRRRK